MADIESASDTDVHLSTLDLAKELIALRSIVPDDAGSLETIANRLARSRFSYERMDRGKKHNRVRNLWARHGDEPPIVCLAGHIDVAPPEAVERWTSDPFTPTERDGCLFGRGAADMKTAVAAMITAAERFVAARPDHSGSVAIALTSDREGAVNEGSIAIVQQMTWRGERIDACILGEPTSLARVGDGMKNGRRGSLNGMLAVKGIQCHIAYPEQGRNPVHVAMPAIAELVATDWGGGGEHFAPASFQISNVQAGTGANNIVPGVLEVQFNFRFGPALTPDDLKDRVDAILQRHGFEYDLSWSLVRPPFSTPPGRLVDALRAAATSVAGVTPALSTSGDTSDGALFALVSHEVVEFGAVNVAGDAVDEHVRLADIAPLSRIYEQTIATLLS
jgi:succinyl-diaminopimelate desuccinylase